MATVVRLYKFAQLITWQLKLLRQPEIRINLEQSAVRI